LSESSTNLGSQIQMKVILLILPNQLNHTFARFTANKNSVMIDLISKAAQLTPIEEYNGVLYKRDDLFRPFEDEMLNGGKVRQAINLIHQNLELIRTDYNGKVATSCQKDSPQGLIISRVAKEYNLGCFIAYGNLTSKTLAENKIIQSIRNNNGIVKSIVKQGFDNVILKHLQLRQEEGAGNNFYIIKFGIDVEHNPIVIDCIADQVQNLPDELDNLIIPTGSGITAGSILRGIQKYKKKVECVYVVHISGENRNKKIREIAGLIPYIYIKGTGYPYGKKLKKEVAGGFVLDEIYEAKAYDWMLQNLDLRQGKTLFWCVGNANYYR